MTTFRPKTRLQAANLLLTALNYASGTFEDFSISPLTVDKVMEVGLTVTPVSEDLSRMLRQVVDDGELAR
jgi:hypothetical protein